MPCLIVPMAGGGASIRFGQKARIEIGEDPGFVVVLGSRFDRTYTAVETIEHALELVRKYLNAPSS